MGHEIPKQFIEVYGKPVIIYTLEAFENNSQIDFIECVCIDGWQDHLEALAKEHNISKLKLITTGGTTGQESIRNGVEGLANFASAGDTVIIHDGVRPMIDQEILTDVIRVCKLKGNAVTSMPYNEQIFVVNPNDESTTTQFIPRETLRRVSTPQAYEYKKLAESYKKAFQRGIGISGSSYTNTMMVELGETLHFAAGSDKNLKLTTPENLESFKAYLKLSQED